MQAEADTSSHIHHAAAARGVLRVLIAGIAVFVFSAAGLARMMGWGASPAADSGDIRVLERTAAAAGPRCPECGVIVLVQENEISVRMADGSSQVIDDASPASWRTGERVMIIGGVKPPSR